MLLKKIALIGTSLVVSALPVLVSATTAPALTTTNNTDEYSTVKIQSSGRCSSDFGKVTRPHSTLTTSQADVKVICGKLSGSCAADLYATPDCDKTGGKPLTTLTIDVSSLNVTPPHTETDRYVIDASGSNVNINYKK